MTPKLLAVSFLILSLLMPAAFVCARQGLDFEVPLPAATRFLDSKDFSFAGKNIRSLLYKSKESPAVIRAYYQRVMLEQGFRNLSASQEQFKDRVLLKFQKEDLVLRIALTPKPEGTEIVISKYLEPSGSLPLEKSKPSLKDSLFALPKEDMPGEDLIFIPRPPQGIRWQGSRQGANAILSYGTPIPAEKLVSFYKEKMPAYGWQLENESAAKEALDTYKGSGGEKAIGLPESPFSDGEDLSGIIGDSYLLEFAGSRGQAQVTIMPNYVDRKLGSIVTIFYNQKE